MTTPERPRAASGSGTVAGRELRAGPVLRAGPHRAGLRTGPARRFEQAPHPERPGSVLLLTSGSTGAPKAVELTEDRLLHVARAVARHHQLLAGDPGFSPLPLFHINAQVVALLASLQAGAALLVDRRFRLEGSGRTRRVRCHLGQRRARDPDDLFRRLIPGFRRLLLRLRFVRFVSAAASHGRPAPDRIAHKCARGRELRHDRGRQRDHRDSPRRLRAARLVRASRRAEAEVRDLRRPSPARAGSTGQIWIVAPASSTVTPTGGGRAVRRRAGRNTGDLGATSTVMVSCSSRPQRRRDQPRRRTARPARDRGSAHRRRRRAGCSRRRPARPILGQVPVAYVIPAQGPETAAGLQHLLDALAARCSAAQPVQAARGDLRGRGLPRAATGKIERFRLRQPA